ncbi:hypothetical protein JCM3770_002240 [Rhodotorula araucariae]
MSVHLDDDVLRLIFEELAATTVYHVDYEARQTSLSNLCLVSRRFRDLAQPLLLRQVWMGHPVWRAQLPVVGLLSSPDVGDLFVSAHLFASIAEMRVGGSVWDGRLRQLVLRCVSLRDTGPVRLPSLEQLVISNCTVTPSILETWLRPTYLPHLVVLRLDGLRKPQYSRIDICAILQPAMLNRFEAIQADSSAVAQASALADSSSPPLLMMAPSGGFLQPGILYQNTLFRHINPKEPQRFWRKLEYLVTRTSQAGEARPQVLVLPIDVNHSTATFPALETQLASFQNACDAHGVRILWHDCDTPGADELFSHAFWRYAKELKATRAAEES